MKKPKRLKVGDTIAAISLSSGMAGESELLWRYKQGKSQLAEMGFKVVDLDFTLAGEAQVYQCPEKRALDLQQALTDDRIAGIISVIGGNDSYRLFEYLDLEVIKNNPKVFIGYSDSTSVHQFFRMAGVVSFYGPCLLVDFAENGGVSRFTSEVFRHILMTDSANYTFPWRQEWTSERLEWVAENKDKKRQLLLDEGPILIQGEPIGSIKGHFMGGCLDVLAMLRGTKMYPERDDFKNGLLLLETSEGYMSPTALEEELRTMGIIGALSQVNGILVGKPQDNKYFDAYQVAIIKVLKEFGLGKLPVLYNCPFGHTEPKWTLPLGVRARLNLETTQIELLETATI